MAVRDRQRRTDLRGVERPRQPHRPRPHRQRGAKPDTLVGLCLERSTDLIAAIFGIHKAGGGYVPLDPHYPADRLSYMIEDADLKYLVTTSASKLNFKGESLLLDQPETWESHPASNPKDRTSATDTAYVIYTSGSTGKPKGVVVEHRNVVQLLFQDRLQFAFGAADVWTLFHSYAFDFSVWEIFGALLYGGRLIVVDPATAKDPEAFLALLEKEQVTVLNQVPSYFTQLSAAAVRGSKKELAVRYLVFGGEAFYPHIVKDWKERYPDTCIVNMYGITETTVHVTYKEIGEQEFAQGISNIGTQLAPLSVYILDPHGRPQPPGIPGEMYVGGAGVARGYLNRPELTAERFVPNPFGEGRLYRTGDLGRRLSDGTIEYLGRIDHQVKIRGFRIELGEIESALRDHSSVEDVIVNPFGDRGEQRLCAYIVGAFDTEELRRHLSEKLPDYMVPAAFMRIEAIPMTPSGKADRKALPDPELTAVGVYTPPQTGTEKALCAIFAEVLGVKRVGIHDNFFASGGDSILALQIVARARSKGFDLAVRDIFKSPDVAGLAARARTLRTICGVIPEPEAPLTPIQKWFFEQEGEKNHYNQSMLVNVPANLDPSKLEQAVEKIIEHHDALRLVFRDGKQVLQGMETFAGRELVRRVDCTGLNSDQKAGILVSEGNKAQQSLDIASGDLLRCVWFDSGNEPGRLLLVIHHLAVDGVSWRILIPDLQAAYEGRPLPEKTTAWTSWACRQEELIPSLREELSYWKNLAQKPGLRIMSDAPERAIHDRSFSFEIDEENTGILLGSASGAYHANPEDLLLASLCLGLERWKGQPLADGILVNLESHGREELFENVDISRTVGWFTSQYPVKIKTGNSLRATLIGIKESIRQTPGNGIAYGLLRYGGHDKLSIDPQISFNYLGRFTTLENDENWSLANEEHGRPISENWKHPALWDINAMVAEDRLQFHLSWPSNVFSDVEMAELKTHMEAGIRQILGHSREASPTFTTSDFPLVKPSQETIDRLAGSYPTLENILPLTPLQQGILFHALESEGAYQVQLHFRVEGKFNPERFRKAWQKTVDRHEILRMAVPEGETGFMVINREAQVPYRFEDRRNDPEPDKRLQAYLETDREEGFDLSRAPLLRLAIFQVTDRAWEIVLNNHHIILDGWSLAIVMADVMKLYAEEPLGRPLPFADYAEWLHRRETDASLEWWRSTFAGFDKPNHIDLATAEKGTGFGEQTLALDPEVFRQLDRLARKLRSTPSTLLQAIWGGLVSRLTGDTDIVFGNVVSGRPAAMPGIENMVGMFINTVPVRLQTEDQTFGELVEKLTTLQGEREQHEFTPLYLTQAQAAIQRGTSLFETLFVYENYPVDESLECADGKDFAITATRGIEAPHYPLTLAVLPGDHLNLRLTHDRSRYDNRGAERLLAWFEAFLRSALQEPGSLINRLAFLKNEERQRVVNDFNRTEVPYPADRVLHRIFTGQALKTPANIAVRDAREALSYEELNARANRIAHALIAKGVGPESLVGLCLERCSGLIAAILAIHKAGGAYVPLDPHYPAERLAFMIEDAGIRQMVSVSSSAPEFSGELLLLDKEDLSSYPDTDPDVIVAPGNAAYVIYTSGSTGKPKGVAVEHGSAVNRIQWMQDTFALKEQDVILQKTTTTFDVSVWELAWWYFAGASVHMLEPGAEKDPARIVAAIEEARVTTLHFVPSMMGAFLEYLESTTKEVERCATLKRVVTSGEALPRGMVERFNTLLRPLGTELHNLYGPTEATIDVSWYPCPAVTPDIIPIGKPVANTRLYVLDAFGNPQPVGVPGELCIGGVQVARGYLNRPELNAGKFVANPFAEGRLYKTGDLARWLEDGNLEYLGRIDQQVKIRGFRIELGEIESALRDHPSVREAIVNPFGDRGEQRLCAYIVGAFDATELRTHLSATLPDYMVPSAFVKLDRLPLTPSGKADRKNLPDPHLGAQAAYTAPRSDGEKILCNLFEEILGVEKVGIHDNFFALGGHSLLATRLINAAGKVFAAEIPLKTIFEQATPACFLEAIRSGSTAAAPPIKKTGQREAPLSFAQSRLWFLDQFEGGSTAYNIPAAFRIQGNLDIDALEKSLGLLIRRHSGLRTIFREAPSGEAFQHLKDFTDFSLPVEAIEGDSIREILSREAHHRFNLSSGPLYRFRLWEIGHQDYVFTANIHHIVFDGWSSGVFFGELSQCYAALSRGVEPELTATPVDYSDYAQWQRKWLAGERLEEQTAYWKDQLEGIPELLSLPVDRPRPEIQSTRGGHVPLEIDPATADILARLARTHNLTLFMVLESLWALFLAKYSGMDDIVVGTPVSGRTRPEIENTIGFFVNTLPLRHQLSGNPTFIEVLEKSRKTALEAFTNQDIPFEKLVEELSPERSTSHSPIFQAMFALADESFEQVHLPKLETTLLFPEFEVAKFDLTLNLGTYGESLAGNLEYNSDLFKRETVERMVAHFRHLAAMVARNPDQNIGDISLLDTREYDQVIRRFNATQKDFPEGRLLHQIFEDQVDKTPDAVAVKDGREELTYSQLNRRANRIAYALITMGVKSEALVALNRRTVPSAR